MGRTRGRRSHGRGGGIVAVVVAVVVVIAALHHGNATGNPSSQPRLPTVMPAAAHQDALIIEPDAGIQPIDALLSSANRSLDLTMYELADPTAEADLAADAQRGVDVRVLLDGRLERSRNASAYDFLRSRGVHVAWSSSRYFATHEKTFVVDDRIAVVMSLNLTARYYATTRDLAIVDRDPHDVDAIESVFARDFSGASVTPSPADDLAWSPTQSGADVVALIRSARHSIDVESEELSDQPAIDALVQAARRGVEVTLVMTYQDEWTSAFNRIVAAGGHVAVLHGETPLYIHAKVLAVDAGTPTGRALIGSQNLADASLDHDRELGVVLVEPALVDRSARLVRADASLGEPWT